MQKFIVYMPVRLFLSPCEDVSILSEVAYSREGVEDKIEETARVMPRWHVWHPVIRIATFSVEEMSPSGDVAERRFNELA